MAGSPGAQPSGKRRRSDRALQVADIIRQQIVRGTAERTLPDESALQKEFGVSRNTVREALDVLRAEGLLERLPGIGTVVATAKFAHVLDGLTGLGQSLTGYGTVTNEVRVAGVVRPPRDVTAQLELAEDTEVVYIERLRRIDGQPISLDLTYFPAWVGEPLLASDLETHDLFGLIERTSARRLATAKVGVEAVNADDHSAGVLGIPRGRALLVLRRLTRFADGRPADLEYLRMRGDLMILNLTPQSFPAAE